MKTPNIQTAVNAVPMIYAYTTPEIKRHDGWIKIGYTERNVQKRVREQTHTADVEANIEWMGNAIFEDGSGETFTDHDFHAYLRKLGIENDVKNEWFHIDGLTSKSHFHKFRENRGILATLPEDRVMEYRLRDEQQQAVDMTVKYYQDHPHGAEFLWNAKPRFGKTLAVYDFCKRICAAKILVVTNRPAIADSWYNDYVKFLGQESGYYFVSSVDTIADKPYVLTRDQFVSKQIENNDALKCIEFVSLQDMKGSIYFGGKYDKLKHLQLHQTVLVIDEAHEGVDTHKTDVAFERIDRDFTLHLSGTPFKALANDKFLDDAIFNWTYVDEQRAKKAHENDVDNPYETLPQLNMFTYQMSDIIRSRMEQGIEINGKIEEFAFDLNEFFAVNGARQFIHDAEVDMFLDALTTQEKFPFSTSELRDKLKHTFWLLSRVDSAKCLAQKLKKHPVFKDYEIILAAGDGNLEDDESENLKSLNKVKKAIKTYDKTITLSVGQLTTGVTIPEWSAVLMLSNIKSPALYMQAAFRCQNPCKYSIKGQFYRKTNAYVFDFDPARTLTIFEEFANDLLTDTLNGHGDTEIRRKHIKELLNFFPVIGEDDNGEMIELDAEKVMQIPRKIHALEVVRCGFMSDFLFDNISRVFVDTAVADIISNMESVSKSDKNKFNITDNDRDQMHLNDDGEVELPSDVTIGIEQDIFGDKIYNEFIEDIPGIVACSVSDESTDVKRMKDQLVASVVDGAIKPIVSDVTSSYSYFGASDQRKLQADLKSAATKMVDKTVDDFNIQMNVIKKEESEALAAASSADVDTVKQEFAKKREDAETAFRQDLDDKLNGFVQNSQHDAVVAAETDKCEKEKKSNEDLIRDHLRGFARTIPAFLMAYGTKDTTLANFDEGIPEDVFKEVTSISLDDFRLLRDGGVYENPNTGEIEEVQGHLFDECVFDEAVSEFMRLRDNLSDYFDENSTEDIFDYIPPQKTNQIFTPKAVVKKMVDLLESENPGCFDQPDKTFIDLYMKSGLYIAEIVKRLYCSSKMIAIYPDSMERLQHIFKYQVYGLAPTKIIYEIVKHYLLGFDENDDIKAHNLRCFDALPFAKDGTLCEKLDELYGTSVHE